MSKLGIAQSSLKGIKGSFNDLRVLYPVAAIGLIVCLSILRFLYSLQLDLHPDEAYYWAWSRILDWSYYDQGPGVAYYIRFFTFLFGDTHLALKLAANFAGAWTIFFIYISGRELGIGAVRSFWVLLLALFVPGFFGGAVLIMHDTPLLLSQAAAIYFLIRYLKRREVWTLYLIFLWIGLGGLSKHTMLFLPMSLVCWLVFTREEWPLLRNAHFNFAMTLSLALVSPILYWNINHNWDGIGAILHLRSSGGSTAAGNNTGDYLSGQLLVFSPLWFLGFLYLVWSRLVNWSTEFYHKYKGVLPGGKVTERSDRGDNPEVRLERSIFRLLWIIALLAPLFFLFMSRNRVIQSNWVFPAYPAIILLLAAWLPKSERNQTNRKENRLRRRLRLILLIGFVPALALSSFALFSGSIVGLLPFRPATFLVPGYKVLGYDSIMREVGEIRQKIDPGAGLATNRYQDAAIATWWSPEHEYVPSLNILQRNQYSYWPYIQKGKNYFILFIQENPCLKTPGFFKIALEEMFADLKELPEKEIIRNGVAVKRYHLYYARNFKKHWDGDLLDYVNNKAILEFMVNLREKPGSDFSADNLGKMRGLMISKFMSSGGALKQKSPGIGEIVKTLLRNPKKLEGCGLFE